MLNDWNSPPAGRLIWDYVICPDGQREFPLGAERISPAAREFLLPQREFRGPLAREIKTKDKLPKKQNTSYLFASSLIFFSKTHKFVLYKQKKKDYNPCGKRKERRTKT